ETLPGTRRAGAGVTRSRRVDRPRRGLSPRVLVHELAERAAADGPVASLRVTEGNGGGDEHVVGYADGGAQLVLDQQVPGRQDAAETDGARREEQVLARGVHRRALVGVGPVVAHVAGDDDDGHALELVREALHGAG